MVYFQEDFPKNGKKERSKNTKPEEIGKSSGLSIKDDICGLYLGF